MAKKAMGLGRGLGGLISSGVTGKAAPKTKKEKPKVQSKAKATRSNAKPKPSSGTGGETLIEVPINQVKPNRYQPRKRINADQIKELAASIKAEGLIQPITARSSKEGYEIIAGERRWRAYRQLGRKTITVRVLEVGDASSASLSLIENLQREGLDPIEEALGCSVLIQDFELTQAQVAERLGKSRVYVTNALRLLQLDEQIQQFLSDDCLSVGHAKVLLGVEDDSARLQLAKKIVGNELSVRQAEDEVAAVKANGKGRTASPAARENAKAAKQMAMQLSDLLKTKVSVSSNGEGKGRITIEYGSSGELATLGSKFGL